MLGHIYFFNSYVLIHQLKMSKILIVPYMLLVEVTFINNVKTY